MSTTTTRRRANVARLKLGEETWGDRLHRAYRQARASRGGKADDGAYRFSYRAVAEKLAEVGFDVSDQTVLRLELHEDVPTRMRDRQLAYFVLIAYGYDPADFGLTPDNVVLTGYDLRKVTRHLAPDRRGA